VDSAKTENCTDSSACNTVGPCEYTSCHTNINTVNSCTNEYDELGWKIRVGFGVISITNNGDNPCDMQASDCYKDTGYVKDWNYNDLQDPGSWKCVKNETNCKTGEKKKIEKICHPN
jgi:hypothetical protein